MQTSRKNRLLSPRSAAMLTAFAGSLALAAAPSPLLAAGFQATPLETLATDTSLKNPWGVSYAPSGPFWVSDNGTGQSTLYSVNPVTNATAKLGLVVSIPGDGSVTGQVYNGTGGFHSDPFLFVNEDGTVSGWRGALGTTAETLQAGSANNVYKGAALATVGSDTYLYAANFRAGTIDVLKGSAAAPNLTGAFSDPTVSSGFAPFDIQNLGGNLFVTYAKQDAAKHDDVAGAGNGFVDEFDTNGNFVKRIASAGTLDSPWGLAIAPSSLGAFSGDLLVGNFGDGRINAFDLSGASGPTLVGQLPGTGAIPLTIDGLWALSVGNGGNAGSQNSLYFTAGPDGESGGVFGVIQPAPVPEASTTADFGLLLILGLGSFMTAARKKKANI